MSSNGEGRRKNVWLPLIIIVLILSGTFLLHKVITVPGEVLKTLTGGFKTEVNINNITYNFFKATKAESKLVVMTSEVTVVVERSNTKRKLWGYLNLGTTDVELKVPGNKVQYILPVDKMSNDDFNWNQKTGELTVYIPRSIVDKDIIEIQSDPGKISVRKKIGWGRLEKYSGQYLEKQIKATLRDEVIKAAHNDLLMKEACRNSIVTIKKIIQNLLRNHTSEVKVVVRFKNDVVSSFKDVKPDTTVKFQEEK